MERKSLAKEIVKEAVVLLKNDSQTLPFSKGQKAVFFGRAQIDTLYSGNGSGAVYTSDCKNILEECEKAGICAEPEVKAFYHRQISEQKEKSQDGSDWTNLENMVNSGIMYELFGKYHAPAEEFEIPDELMEQACAYTDTAVLIIGRNSGGEECDRHLQEDYYLTATERKLTEQVCRCFEKVVLILNVNGLIDLAWTEAFSSVKSILFAGIFGEEGAAALADIMAGNTSPSGKMAVTVARNYEDYPSAAHFSWDKEHPDRLLTYENYGLCAKENGSTGFQKSPVTVYWEDIYAGYRYFDTFAKEPLFPFGFGMSYTQFAITVTDVAKNAEGIEVTVKVVNIGKLAGKETIQIYLSVHSDKKRAFQELKGFEKTKLLEPGTEETMILFLPWKEWASYDEEQAAYIVEKGEYKILAGNSSRDTQPVVSVKVEKDILIKQCRNRLGLRKCNKDKLAFLSCPESIFDKRECARQYVLEEKMTFIDADRGCGTLKNDCEPAKCEKDIEKEKIAKKVETLSVEQLAALCVGYGPGTPFAALSGSSDPATIFDTEGKPLTTNSHPAGFDGYVSPAIVEKGIFSLFYKDGPAGIGKTAWPTEMLMACAFNKKLWYEFGNAVGEECERQQVDIWLAPAVNLHRNPLGGRNFEYFSEDSWLTGICACEITKGVQENHPVLVCPKHFVVNEQETYRRGSVKKGYDATDSIIGERAARELYLKPFEMLVKEGNVLCIMTSFNKINGVFAGGNAQLCTGILRDEWGFEGFVVTDWGDMDIVVDGADAVAAGNDIIMPGGPPVIRQILQGYQEGRLTRESMEKAVVRLVRTIEKHANGRMRVEK